MTSYVSAHSLARQLNGWQASGEGNTSERLASAISARIVDGALPVKARMPSERDAAAELRVSRTTVAAAYARLREQGFLLSRRGAGSWTSLPARGQRALGPLTHGDGVAGAVDLTCAAPGPMPAFLVEAFQAALADLPAELARAGSYADHGYHPAGTPVLRAAIAARYTARGVPTTPQQIAVTAGGQGAINLLAQALLDRRDVVLVEQPTYPNAAEAFRRTGARIVGVPVTTDGGWDDDFGGGVLSQTRPKLAYVIPDFQNPTGAVMSAADREAMVATARASGTLLLADESLVDTALDGQQLPPPVAAFDRDDRVVSVGSLSKSFWGGLRIGWLRASPRLIAQLGAVRSSIDHGSPVLEQLAAVHLLEHGEAALAARRAELRGARDVLERELAAEFPHWRWTQPAGGLSLWVALDEPISTALCDAATRHGLRLAAGPRFGLDGTLERFLRFPFTSPVGELTEAVRRLRLAYDELGVHGHHWPATTPVVA